MDGVHIATAKEYLIFRCHNSIRIHKPVQLSRWLNGHVTPPHGTRTGPTSTTRATNSHPQRSLTLEWPLSSVRSTTSLVSLIVESESSQSESRSWSERLILNFDSESVVWIWAIVSVLHSYLCCFFFELHPPPSDTWTCLSRTWTLTLSFSNSLSLLLSFSCSFSYSYSQQVNLNLQVSLLKSPAVANAVPS